ncbi:hypothetical protein M2322_002829 [Rhodoblastus acidophilus]|uniref:hypothetical protein n=1 Tax=Rhodoblastus acidophilus TaxID=1074 RepID=UPI002224EE0A|nr:hypothetical protein [Rhodoblastus acidophilus]MCW2317270.1 hypothetical protein [Rhodoblastus acidophilus]
MQLAAGTGALFPNPSAGQYFKITFISANPASTANEICNVTAVSGDILTIVRGQEGTAAQAWNAGDVCSHQLTAGSLGAFLQSVGASSQFYQGTDTSATPNDMMVASFTPTLASLASGQVFLVTKNAQSNTGAMTLKYTIGGTAYAVTYSDGTALIANDWPGGVTGWLYFTGSVFQVLAIGLHTLPIDGGTMTGLLNAPAGFTTNVDTYSSSQTITTANSGHVVEVTAGTAATFSLFNPSIIKSQMRFYNNSAATHTLSTAFGHFFGPTIGGTPTTHTFGASDIVDIVSDGSNWLCLDWDAIIQSYVGGHGITNIQMITASGTYTPTVGAVKGLVFATGAGGSPIDTPAAKNGTGTAESSNGVTTAKANEFVLYLSQNWDDTAVAGPSTDPSGFAGAFNWDALYCATKIFSAAGATGTITPGANTNTGVHPWSSFAVALVSPIQTVSGFAGLRSEARGAGFFPISVPSRSEAISKSPGAAILKTAATAKGEAISEARSAGVLKTAASARGGGVAENRIAPALKQNLSGASGSRSPARSMLGFSVFVKGMLTAIAEGRGVGSCRITPGARGTAQASGSSSPVLKTSMAARTASRVGSSISPALTTVMAALAASRASLRAQPGYRWFVSALATSTSGARSTIHNIFNLASASCAIAR